MLHYFGPLGSRLNPTPNTDQVHAPTRNKCKAGQAFSDLRGLGMCLCRSSSTNVHFYRLQLFPTLRTNMRNVTHECNGVVDRFCTNERKC